MFGSLITQPLRIATRSVQITLRGAHGAVEIAEGLVGLIAARTIGRNGHRNGDDAAEPAAWRGPAASSTSAPADASAPVADSPAPEPTGPAAEPTGPAPEPSASAPEAPAAPPPTAAPPASSTPTLEEVLDPEAGHVSEDAELVEEVAEPGAEDGAGAQLHIAEPWDGYGTMKAGDIVDRLTTASPEELAAVELYELAGRNRKSVVVAAQRALKRASPPRP